MVEQKEEQASKTRNVRYQNYIREMEERIAGIGARGRCS